MLEKQAGVRLVLVGNPMSLVTGGGNRALLGACSSGRQGGTEGQSERGRERERKGGEGSEEEERRVQDRGDSFPEKMLVELSLCV